MSRTKILVVEDDKNILKLVKYNLEKANFNCLTTSTGEDALKLLDREDISLVLLDIMLPKMDGLQTCKEIRQNKKTSQIPVIIMTAKGEEVDRVVGFELGADDYVVKPFSPRELILRVKAILKRNAPLTENAEDELAAGDLKVDIAKHRVTYSDKKIELTAMEFKLLTTLMSRRGLLQSRDKLLEDVWGISSDINTRTVDTHIKRLRQKLGKGGRFIETVRGIGYTFSEEG